jgi:hypothetical protein
MEGIMRKTRISVAVLAAFALGSAAPLFAQTADDDPSKDPPTGGRIPASADTPQGSGDTSSDEPSAAGTSSQSGTAQQQQSDTSSPSGTESSQTPSAQSGGATSGDDASAQGGHSGASGTSGQGQGGSQSPAPGAAPGGTQDQPGMQDQRGMQDPRGMHGRWQAQAPNYHHRYPRDARRWDDGRMAWDDEGRSSRYPDFRDDYYRGDYYRGDRYRDDARYYSRDRYDPGFDRDYRGSYDDRGWNAMGEFDARDRWSRGPRWSELEEGSGYTYRDRDDYYAGRDDYYAERDDYDPRRSRYYRDRGWGPERSGEHMGRGQSYYEDAYGDYRDPYRYRDGGQWRGERYSGRWQGNPWRDQPGSAQRWDERDYRGDWRDQRGTGMGDMTDPYQRDQGWQGGQQGQPGQPSGAVAGQTGAGAATSQQGGTSVGGGSQPGTQAGSIPGTQSGSTTGATGATSGSQSGSSVR